MISKFLLVSVLAIANGPPDAAILKEGIALYNANKPTESAAVLCPLAEKGIVKAQHFYALACLENHALDTVETETIKLGWDYLKKAADTGYADSEYTIATAYEMGLYGKAKDQDAGWFWMQRAAEHGNVSAISIVGQTYYGSDFFPSVKTDYKKALTWLNKAARKGDSMSMFILSRMYEKGAGVPQDFIEAHAWMNLASAHDDLKTGYSASLRDALERRMTNSQIAQAQARAKSLKKVIKPLSVLE